MYHKTTIKASDTLEHQPTVWPVPYACAQPYHPGSGSHGQLFRRCEASTAWHSRRAENRTANPMYTALYYTAEACAKHPFKRPLHTTHVKAAGWDRTAWQFWHGMR